MGKPILISPISKQAVAKQRVGAYCRVSSNSADQLNSYANQLRYYTKYIKEQPDWELVDVFADEGISGMQAETRPEFMRMIEMAKMRQLDLIITKSISRFARNVKDSLTYVRELKRLGVGVIFEKEGINTLSLGDEMLLNTFSAIAQEESKSISQNQRLSIVKRMEMGEYVDSNAPYGFRLVNKKLQVYEPEAKNVRMIFALYLSGKSTLEIARMMNECGIPSKTGKVWRAQKIGYILRNERYIGDCNYQKTRRETTVPFKQTKNHGEEDMYYATDTHDPIVSEETFEKVRELLSKRSAHFGKATELNTYPLTSHIRCSECGSIYHRKVRKGGIQWVCCKHEADKDACDSNYYSEERIYDGFVAIVNKLRFGDEDVLMQVQQKLESAMETYKWNNAEAKALNQEIADLNAKMLALEQLKSRGYITMEVYQNQSHSINNRLSQCKSAKQDAFSTKVMERIEQVKALRSIIWEIEDPLDAFDEKLFYELVKDMTIDKNDNLTITLPGDLKFTEEI